MGEDEEQALIGAVIDETYRASAKLREAWLRPTERDDALKAAKRALDGAVLSFSELAAARTQEGSEDAWASRRR